MKYLFGLCLLAFLFAVPNANAQAPSEGAFLEQCEAQNDRNLPFIPTKVADAECEAEYYFFVKAYFDCDIECALEWFYSPYDPIEEYDGNENMGCTVTCMDRPD